MYLLHTEWRTKMRNICTNIPHFCTPFCMEKVHFNFQLTISYMYLILSAKAFSIVRTNWVLLSLTVLGLQIKVPHAMVRRQVCYFGWCIYLSQGPHASGDICLNIIVLVLGAPGDWLCVNIVHLLFLCGEKITLKVLHSKAISGRTNELADIIVSLCLVSV